MARFEELQALWQRQEPPAGAFDMAPLTGALDKYGRMQTRIVLAKVAVIVLLIAWQITQLVKSGGPFGMLVVALETAGAAVLIHLDWRNRRAIARLNFAEPSAAFVGRAIDRLRALRDPFQKYYWQIVLSLALVFNATLLTLPRSTPPLGRLGWHAIFSALPFAMYELGRWVRAWRFEVECRPLLDRLTELQQALEERSE